MVLAVVPSGGCALRYFTISIPDFGTKVVGGVWLWRLSTTTGLYERDTQFVFSPAAGEMIDYSVVLANGAPPQDMTTGIKRDPQNADKAVISLLYVQEGETAYYRASTFNTTGDSPLSGEIVPL